MNGTMRNSRWKDSFQKISQNTYPIGNSEVTAVLYAPKLGRDHVHTCAVEVKTGGMTCALKGLSFGEGKRVIGMLVKHCVSPAHLRDAVEDMRRDDLYGAYLETE